MSYLLSKLNKYKNIIKAKAKQKKDAEVAKSLTKLTYSCTYVGLSYKDVKDNEHILTMVLNLVRGSVPSRILRAKGGANIEMNASDNLDIYSCLKITYWCYYKDQYCSECGSYGCSGGC